MHVYLCDYARDCLLERYSNDVCNGQGEGGTPNAETVSEVAWKLGEGELKVSANITILVLISLIFSVEVVS